ncbi:hypothetical protein Mic7113_0277 [Allocoleopsis franciscana PCC 7113]|uniref:Uncharacterized protein n=1 Tax=Allocoleopsis franciscana PCC 7113 TaxID=1173027 RepID=K9W9N4_9CYAN|nr:hypothetical protein Mic7113_0277 [Allocoleopsis franciscana PCC 7113]
MVLDASSLASGLAIYCLVSSVTYVSSIALLYSMVSLASAPQLPRENNVRSHFLYLVIIQP